MICWVVQSLPRESSHDDCAAQERTHHSCHSGRGAASTDSFASLAKRYGISEETARKWKKRTSVHDASHTPHRLQTTLTPAQEWVVIELRRTVLLPLDDLLAVTREFICPKATRSGQDRCTPRQNTCRLDRTKNPGAAMKDGSGSIRTSIQRQSGGQVAAAGERLAGGGLA